MGAVGPVRLRSRLIFLLITRVVGASTVGTPVLPRLGRRDVVPLNPFVMVPLLRLAPREPLPHAAIHVVPLTRVRPNERTATAVKGGVAVMASRGPVGLTDVPLATGVEGA